MEKNTGKVREKSGIFVSPEKWEPCYQVASCCIKFRLTSGHTWVSPVEQAEKLCGCQIPLHMCLFAIIKYYIVNI